MEVLLKKAKITSAIIKQAFVNTELESFKDFEMLGWCYYKDRRYFVLHKDGLLKLMVYDTTLKVQHDWEQVTDEGRTESVYRVWITRPNRPTSQPKFKDEKSAEKYKQDYQALIDEGKRKGQFYI